LDLKIARIDVIREVDKLIVEVIRHFFNNGSKASFGKGSLTTTGQTNQQNWMVDKDEFLDVKFSGN